ncbi:pyruvate ferredoxin oxidoreductase [Sutterella massiliensis]|uniref:Pyruvate ferredoxin oxidoreductase n=1 Tax=Sutterella massiliensis TaxID=1816689 RepID=A0ABS2DR10_9BURK|nr:transketolase C-terminal domain-containing protein [Sutterella massiliensis]MBM6703150.1 pyruvate ferredoxin oxidoreductase [Sutterella massiliensis]
MLKQLEGSQGVAQAVALCRPDVVCAYPISPQTHIVENLGLLCRKGILTDCEYINVESEFAAMSVAIGASVAGGRAYTATASQGLLYMVEAVYNAGGLGLPIVMTVANRAIGAPINIWNDHSDSMSQRDSGWIQLFAETNQEACDLHIQAFRIAEEVSLPVMVCMDGFVLTHAFERMDIPTQEEVDRFLPPYEPRQVLDPANPYSIGAMVGPEAFTEVRWLAHHRMLDAIDVIERTSRDFEAAFGRLSGGLISTYRMEDAEVVVLAMGSMLGTIKDAVDEMCEAGLKIGVLSLKCYRPFPYAAVREALKGAKQVIVMERMVSAGTGGALCLDVMKALKGLAIEQHSVIAGLGGRAVTRASLKKVFGDAFEGKLPDDTVFLDLDEELVTRQLERERSLRHIGPVAEALNRHVNERKIARGEEV